MDAKRVVADTQSLNEIAYVLRAVMGIELENSRQAFPGATINHEFLRGYNMAVSVLDKWAEQGGLIANEEGSYGHE